VLKALEEQTVGFKFVILDGYRPLPVALQAMIDQCDTKYYIQCDEDMILKSNAIEIMYKTAVASKEICHIFPYYTDGRPYGEVVFFTGHEWGDLCPGSPGKYIKVKKRSCAQGQYL
jgi:hypothetical protein